MKYQTFAIIAILLLNSCGPENAKQDQSDLINDSLDNKTNPVEFDTSPRHVDSTKSATAEDLVLDIRKEFQQINALPLDASKHSFVCDTYGTITYYRNNGKVVKIGIDWGFIGDGSATSEYYYKNGKLIFEYEVFIGAPAGLPDTRTEQRIYVNNDKTIRFMRDQEIIGCRKCEFGPSSREYKAYMAFEMGNIHAALCN